MVFMGPKLFSYVAKFKDIKIACFGSCHSYKLNENVKAFCLLFVWSVLVDFI